MIQADDAEERLKIFDTNGQYIGEKNRDAVHLDGDIHYVIHCWVWLDETDELLIQVRSLQKKFGAGKLDVSCAGHYSADETFESTRELWEELGIDVPYQKLQYIFDFEEIFEYEDYNDHEIARIHLLKQKSRVFKPVIESEVTEILKVNRESFVMLMKDELKEVTGHTQSGKPLTLTQSDFVLRSKGYYKKLCNTLSDMKVMTNLEID